MHCQGRTTQRGWRLSATEIERAMAIAARAILDDRPGLLETLEKSEIDSPDVRAMLEAAADYSPRLTAQIDMEACLTDLVERVELLEHGIRVSIKLPARSVGRAGRADCQRPSSLAPRAAQNETPRRRDTKHSGRL
jgi:hypothetical protein